VSGLRNALFAAGLLLLALGAGTARAQTVNIEVDWMADELHTHKPNQSEIDAVVQMYACHGITLNVVLDHAIAEVPLLASANSGTFFSDTTSDSTFAYLKSFNFRHRGVAGWHYCIFGHNYQLWGKSVGSSGVSELPGYCFFVAMGSFPSPSATSVGTAWERAATFAHELGHNFGLTHAGSMNEFTVGNAVPVYPSLMSYLYQLRGVKTHMQCLGLIGSTSLFKDLDYSNGRMPVQNEWALNETQGLGIVPTDWNCDGVIGGIVSKALNDTLNYGTWCNATRGGRYALNDTNDWAIVLNSIAHPPVPLAVPTTSEPCISHSEMLLSALSATSTPGFSPTQYPVTFPVCFG